ncbi:uncharacterized protein LOC143253863 isoform X2 [Tachypleus tridentatus]
MQEPSSTSSPINGTSETRKPDPKKRCLTEELLRLTEQEVPHPGSRNEATSPLMVSYSKDDASLSDIGHNGIEKKDCRNISLRIQPKKQHFRTCIPVHQQYHHLLSSSSPTGRSNATGSRQKTQSTKTSETVLKQNPVQSVEAAITSFHGAPTQRSYRTSNPNSRDQHASFQNPSSSSQVCSFTSSFRKASPYQISNPFQTVGPSISVTPSVPQGAATDNVHLHCSCDSQLGKVMEELKYIQGLLEVFRSDLKKQREQSLLAVNVHPHGVTDSPQFSNTEQKAMLPLSEPHHLVNEIQKGPLYIKNQFSNFSTLITEEPLENLELETSANKLSEESVEVDRCCVQHLRENSYKFQKSHQQKRIGGTENEEVQAIPEKQYKLSEKELEEILASCNSPQHFAVFLMRKTFTEKERLSGNVNGCRKPPLNPAKIKYIKYLVEKFYEFDKTDQSVWKMCVKAIDSANRNFRNRGEIIKRREV